MSNRRSLFLLFAVLAGLLFLEAPRTWLFDPDEARYAEIPREMLASRDYLTPRLNGSVYFEKPPLLYWLNAGSMKFFGQTPYAARLPTRLATFATALLLVFGLGGVTGWWAAIVFLSSPLGIALGRTNLTDGILSASLTAAFFCLRAFFRERDAGRSGALASVGLGAAAALGVLSKGLVGVVFPAAVAVAWPILTGKRRLIVDALLSWAVPVCAVIAVPWFVLVGKANPGFAHFFFIREHVQRFTTEIHHRDEPAYFFVAVFAAGFLPWLPALWRRLKLVLNPVSWRDHQDDLYFFLWFACVIGFFSLSHSKLVPYILPAFPAAAALAGKRIAERSTQRPYVVVSAASAALYLLLIYMLPGVSNLYSMRTLAIQTGQADADTVVCYRTYCQSAPFELKRPVPVVDFRGELGSLPPLDPKLFWSDGAFWERWNSDERIVAIMEFDEADTFQSCSLRAYRVVARNGRTVALANFAPAK